MSSQPSGPEPRGQCMMAAASPPRPFRRLASRGSFSRFPCVVAFTTGAIYLARCLTLHDQAPWHGECAPTQYRCLYDTLSCYFYTALWLGQLSFHIDANTTFWRTWYGLLQDLPFGLYRSQVGSMSFEAGPRNWKTVRTTLGSFGRNATRNLPWTRCQRYFHCHRTWRPLTNPLHFRSQKWSWESSFQTCTTWTRTVVWSCCSWPMRT